MQNQIRLLELFNVFITLFIFVSCSQSPSKEIVGKADDVSNLEHCTISNKDRESLLNLDFKAFDQSLPSGGWRKYQQCPLLTRRLIDAYTTKHSKTLEKQQSDGLNWHNGQMSGMAGDYADAVAKMSQTYNPKEKTTDAFQWNPYVSATIAFLKKDKAELLKQRKLLARGSSPFNHLNLRQVDSLIRCFKGSYEEAYSGACDPQETNIERIRSLAVPLDLTKPFPRDVFGLSDFFKMKKIILVGEMHGTKKTLELFGHIVETVAEDKSTTLVALEINRSSQTSVDEFLKSGNDLFLRKDPFFTRDFQDGRSSRAMVALLFKLRSLPGVKVLCIDPEGEIQIKSGQERETAMANLINFHRHTFDHTVVLTGNTHSSTSVGAAWDRSFRPMAFELNTMASDLGSQEFTNVLIRYGSANSWNCQSRLPSTCKARYGKTTPNDYSEAVNFASYFIWENKPVDGHSVSIFIRNADVSPPFIGSR